ncbi:hypothetical protein E0H77_00660 [Acinetobacter sp. ANC 4633]|uniref:hypothetical protein n=1 Tax=Acinetobacter sp. ANC 4633 TaxID=2529845 RepID=UPI001038AB09|nr:hypothetical protein [Acinetobacter sp. ANC 4633]TCB28690.1 hypothetical protein E0H77_00660 [Acinetobacter sp. ANC 4633]
MSNEKNNPKEVNNLGRLTLDLVQKLKIQEDENKTDKTKAGTDSEKLNDSIEPRQKISPYVLAEPVKKKAIGTIDFNFLELSISQIQEMSSDDLLKLLSGEGHKGAIRESTIHLISNELLIRQIKEASKPHWTTNPMFYLTCMAVLFGFVAAAASIVAILK